MWEISSTTNVAATCSFKIRGHSGSEHSYCRLKWVHTCNVTAYRNAVTLQVADTIRSYELNFHPVPDGLTVSCERYTLVFHFVTGARAMSLQLAAASYIYIHNALKRSGRWWGVTLPVHTCSSRNRIIPLMRQPNTDSTPNKPVTLPRNQLLIRYVVTRPVTLSRYGVKR
jgi:hypothetical protein